MWALKFRKICNSEIMLNGRKKLMLDNIDNPVQFLGKTIEIVTKKFKIWNSLWRKVNFKANISLNLSVKIQI